MLEPRHLLALVPGNEFVMPMNSDFDLAADADGDFVLAARDSSVSSGRIAVQRFNAAGVAQGSPIRVGVLTNGAPHEHSPQIDMDDAGNVAVMWTLEANTYFRIYNADGSARTDKILLDTNVDIEYNTYDIAMDSDGDIAVTWREKNIGAAAEHPGFETRLQLFDANGVAKGPAFGVSPIPDSRIVEPRLVMDDAGNFVVAYLSSPESLNTGALWVQPFMADGSRPQTPFAVSAASFIGGFDIDMNSGGDFAVTWHQSGPSGQVFVQSYSFAGVALTGVLQANETPTNLNWDIDVAMDDSGATVVTWHSAYPEPNSPTDIFARRLLPDGTPDTAEFRVNETVPGTQYSAQVTSDDAGRLFFTWFEQGQVFSLFARQYQVGVNIAATANDDAYATSADRTLTVSAQSGLLSNDRELDGDGAASDFDLDGTPDVNDADDDNDGVPDNSDAPHGKVRAQLVGGPAHGFAHVNRDGSFTYTPASGYSGPDSFSYRILENNGTVGNIAIVNLAVNSIGGNSMFTADNVIVPSVNSPLTLSDWASFHPGSGGPYSPTYMVSNVSDPALFQTLPAVAPNGTLSFQIASGRIGIVTFDVTLDDGAGGGETQTFSITAGHAQQMPLELEIGQLTVRDSAGADSIEVFGGRAGEVFVRGSTGQYRALGVTGNVRVLGGAGDDSFNVHNLFVAQTLQLHAGEGNNHIRLGVDGIVSAGWTLNLTAGAGNDRVDCLNAYMGSFTDYTSYIRLGEGNNTANFYDPAAVGTFRIGFSSIARSSISSGTGNDVITVHYAFIPGAFDIWSGGGNDRIELFGSAISGETYLNGEAGANTIICDTNFLPGRLLMFGNGSGRHVLANTIHGFNDVIFQAAGTIEIRNITADLVTIYGGLQAADTVDIRSSLVEGLFADLGGNDDTLTLYGNRVNDSLFIDGGDGTDRLIDLGGTYPAAFTKTRWELFS
jgi:hypothetical protein